MLQDCNRCGRSNLELSDLARDEEIPDAYHDEVGMAEGSHVCLYCIHEFLIEVQRDQIDDLRTKVEDLQEAVRQLQREAGLSTR